MVNGIGSLLIFSLFASPFTGPQAGNLSVSAFSSGLSFNLQDLYPPGERTTTWGYGVAAARPLNFRLSIFAIAAPILITDVTDDDDSREWNELWLTGGGGGMGFAFQLMPIFRFGGGAGYLGFHGSKDKTLTDVTDYEPMHLVPINVEGTLCFPLELPVQAWFLPGKGYAAGPVPYIQVDFGWVYRTKVEAKHVTGGTRTTLEIFKQAFRSFFGARIGLEFRKEQFGFFIDFGYRVFERPKKDDDLVGNALEMHTCPVQLGFAFYFGG
ncbi:MAG: hypothetical protein ACYTHM_05310 [Planctomycetota bacterium]|jgi:hypothetical protein